MKMEDIKIEDAADANYVIRKFFNNDFSNMKMTQLEQLVLTVYSMGKNNGVSTDVGGEVEPKSAPNPFKVSDRVKIIEDVEIGKSGEFIKANSVGSVTFIKEETTTVLFEESENGEMVEVNVLFDKLEKV